MTVRDGVLVQTSVSEITTYDHAQEGGCERRWWFERAADLRPEQTKAQEEGDAGHALLAHYLETGERPKGRPLMGKAVTGAIVKGDLPKPGDDLLVEIRFDGQSKRDAAGKWIALDTTDTLRIAGVPLDGFIDLTFRRGDVPEVWDHKFFSPARPDVSDDPYAWLKKPSELIKTVQMPVYALSQMPFWPDAKRWRLVHHYVSKKGVDSLIRAAVVDTAEVLERGAEITAIVERMKLAAAVTEQGDIPFNRRSCTAWRGCPHQSICSAFRNHQEKPPVSLTPEEAALFADLDDVNVEGETPPAAPAPAAPAPSPAPRKFRVIDEPAPAAPDAVPVPEASATTEKGVICDCGEPITADNGSKLQTGKWVHVGCQLQHKPAEPAPRTRKPKAKPEAPAAESPKDEQGKAVGEMLNATVRADLNRLARKEETITKAPAFAGERASDRDATAALDAMAAAKAAPPAPAATAPAPTLEVKAAAPLPAVHNGAEPVVVRLGEQPNATAARIALAETFEGIAKLLRSVA